MQAAQIKARNPLLTMLPNVEQELWPFYQQQFPNGSHNNCTSFISTTQCIFQFAPAIMVIFPNIIQYDQKLPTT
jgi:hypothetical protein